MARSVHIVIAHYRYVFGHLQTARIEYAHGIDGHQITGGEQAIDGNAFVAKRMHGFLGFKRCVRRLNEQVGIEFKAMRLQRLAIPFKAQLGLA